MIKEAAIKLKNGTVFSLPRPARHNHLIADLVAKGNPTPISGLQGFLTTDGIFVDRKEGLSIALENNQIVQKHGNSSLLFSEDMW